MSVAALKIPEKIAPPDRSLYQFTVDQYLRMVETGVLGPDDHVELLEGWIVYKMSRNPPHDGTINYILPILMHLLPVEWIIRVQSALVLARSVPEPDLAIVRGPASTYFKRHPRAADADLLIEVADTSRLTDRKQKGLWYAEAKVPAFWLVNLVEGRVEVYSQPRGGKSPAYRQRRDYHPGEMVPLLLAGQRIGVIAVNDLCPVSA
jgi:hypothetical protein